MTSSHAETTESHNLAFGLDIDALVVASGRGLGSKIRKAVKRAVKSAIRGILRSLESLLRPITRLLDKVWELVKLPYELTKSMAKAVPKLLQFPTKGMPRPSEFLDAIETFLVGAFEVLIVVPLSWSWKWLRGTWSILWNWVGDNFPRSSWQSVDNAMGEAWIIGTTATMEIVKALSGGFGYSYIPSLAPTWRGTLGYYNSFRTWHYIYRIVVPFVSGLIATLVCLPEWILKLAVSIPSLTADLLKWTWDCLRMGIRELVDKLISWLGELVRVAFDLLLKPIKYLVDIALDVLEPITDLF